LSLENWNVVSFVLIISLTHLAISLPGKDLATLNKVNDKGINKVDKGINKVNKGINKIFFYYM